MSELASGEAAAVAWMKPDRADVIRAEDRTGKWVNHYTVPLYDPTGMKAAWTSGYNTHAMGGRLGGKDDPPASIPAAEVQALVEEWRKFARNCARTSDQSLIDACADELAKLIPRGA